jgi:hypothetical protein
MAFGFLRVICNNLKEFRIYNDLAIQSTYYLSNQETGGYGFGYSRFSSPAKKSGTNNLRLFSYGFLFKNIYILDMFLNFTQKRQLILANFT